MAFAGEWMELETKILIEVWLRKILSCFLIYGDEKRKTWKLVGGLLEKMETGEGKGREGSRGGDDQSTL
jgi:hypothetical protein